MLHVPLPADFGCQRVVKCCLLIYVDICVDVSMNFLFDLRYQIRTTAALKVCRLRAAHNGDKSMRSVCIVWEYFGVQPWQRQFKGYGYGESAKSAAVPRLKKHGTSRPKIFKTLNINEFSYSHFFSLHFVVVTRNGISGRARLSAAPLQSVVDEDDLDIALTETRPPVSAGRFEAIRQEAKAIETKHNSSQLYVLIVHHHSQQFQQWTG